MNIRINPEVSAADALRQIEKVVKSIAPSVLFSYKFVDAEYAAKFSQETCVGTLAGIFSALAIFISCLGLSALSSLSRNDEPKRSVSERSWEQTSRHYGKCCRKISSCLCLSHP